MTTEILVIEMNINSLKQKKSLKIKCISDEGGGDRR